MSYKYSTKPSFLYTLHPKSVIYQQIILSLEISSIQVYQNKDIWEKLNLIQVQNDEDNWQITEAEGNVLFWWVMCALWSCYTLKEEMDSFLRKNFK